MCQYCCNDVQSHPFSVNSPVVYDAPIVQPGFTIAQYVSGDTLIDGLLYSASAVRSPVGQGATVSYSFDSTVNSAAQASIVKALDVWSSVANLTFNQGGGSAPGGSMYFIVENLGGGVRGKAEIPPSGTNIWLNSAIDANLSMPGPLASSLLHEIGHSLGLAHTFGGVLNLETTGQHHADYSVMAYSSADGASSFFNRTDYFNGVGYADVKAIQYLYGANTNYNGGDTFYDFGETFYGALWDGGGANDVISAEGDSNGARIDLRDGGPDIDARNEINSSKFYLAHGAVIEHAKGSHAADNIIGGDTPNELYGNGGADTIYGGSGGDVIFGGRGFSDSNDGNDKIYGGNQSDLIIGNSGDDQIFGDGGPGAAATNPGNDTLYGGAGSDFINGEQGFDLIVGGPGQDSLYGGADADVFAFGHDVSGGVNIIYDFQGAGGPGGDMIRILYDVNGSGITSAADVIANIVEGSGHSYIQLAGSSGGSAILVAFTQGLTVDDIAIVDAAGLLAPVG